jgi:hypothetical protein
VCLLPGTEVAFEGGSGVLASFKMFRSQKLIVDKVDSRRREVSKAGNEKGPGEAHV